MNLFIDTSNWNLIILLEKNDQIIDKQIVNNTKKVSDILMENINVLFSKNNISIHDIDNLYVTTGPGSYTGVRVGLTFVKTLKTLSKKFNIYSINSLQFQAGLNDKVISLLDARGNKSYFGIYENGSKIIEESVLNNNELENVFKKYGDYQIVKDYDNLNYENNFINLKNNFILIDNEENLKPIYLKNFI